MPLTDIYKRLFIMGDLYDELGLTKGKETMVSEAFFSDQDYDDVGNDDNDDTKY